MIDLTLLRKEPQTVAALLTKKDPAFPLQKLIDLDVLVRELMVEVESLRSQKNELAKQARSGLTEAVREQSIALGKRLKEQESNLVTAQKEFKDLYLCCPNLAQEDVPEGNKESNKVVKTVGEKPTLAVEPRHHLELGENNQWFDLERAAKIAGSQFVLYTGQAPYLMYALTMFMLKNNSKHGFTPVIPPYLVNARSLEVAGNFPKFKDDVYAVEGEDLYLTPTAEADLANIYRDQILSGDQLPIRMTAWTSCFRKEAGGYGATERGLIRIHQFEKVELFTLCKPENSPQELDRMIACAEDILQQLGLHYRISLLAGQDCSFASAKTYDIEVWLPGQKAYYEVSSCSNCTDFQARRGAIRYKEQGDKKTHLVHTLNGSSLALPRLMVALMETYQQPDGSIHIPEVLRNEGIWG